MDDEETEYGMLRDALERANPHDEDAAEVHILVQTIDRLIDFIEALDCECAPDAGPPSEWDVAPCPRCKALNRAQNYHPDSTYWMRFERFDSDPVSNDSETSGA